MLEKNDLFASFQQALLRDEGKWLAKVGNPILVGLPAERGRAGYPVEVIFLA